MAIRSKLPAAPPPIGRAVGDTLAIFNFTATNPTTAQVDGADAGKVFLGDTWTLAAVAGDPDAMAAIDGASATVDAISGDIVTLGLDLSAVLDVSALAASATVTSEAPAPSPSPPPSPSPAEQAEKILTSTPSPGVGTLPVEPAPDATMPGLAADGLSAPNPDDPTGPALTGAALDAAITAWKSQRRAALDALNTPPPPAPSAP
jgi:hypothetical protein